MPPFAQFQSDVMERQHTASYRDSPDIAFSPRTSAVNPISMKYGYLDSPMRTAQPEPSEFRSIRRATSERDFQIPSGSSQQAQPAWYSRPSHMGGQLQRLRRSSRSPFLSRADIFARRCREWTVEAVTAKRIEAGEERYRVLWGQSTVQRQHIHQDEYGQLYVRADGVLFPVENAIPTDFGRTSYYVQWPESWHKRSDLAGTAEDTIAEFERHRPRRQTREMPASNDSPTGNIVGATLSNSFEYTDEDGHRNVHPIPPNSTPPREIGSCGSTDLFGGLSQEPFLPRSRIDYTANHEAVVREALAAAEFTRGKKSLWVKYAQMPNKRPLIFRDRYIRQQLPIRSGRYEYFVSLLVYRVGQQQNEPCKHCIQEEGPFQACIAEGDILGGACTNCAYRGKGPECAHHRQSRCVPDQVWSGADKT